MSFNILHYIHGQHHINETESMLPVHNPATGQIIAKVPIATEETIEVAISAAKKAFYSWAETPITKRSKILFKYRALLEKHQQELAQKVTLEHGKTLADAQGSVARGIELVEWHCGLLHQFQTRFTQDVATDIDTYTVYEPLGICVGISPFNFPVMVPLWMMIPAISCGNTFILKPSEQDPSVTVMLMELLHDAGLPDGVVNCVHGDKHTVDYLIKHNDIKACTAVASSAVAEHIYQTAILHGKRAHTFGGAKNHCLVMPDADIPKAAEAIVGAAYGSAGERCMALSVIVAVGQNTADQLLEAMIPLIQSMKIDAGHLEHTDMGPLISATHREKVIKAINQGVEAGAQLVLDGRHFIHPTHPEGYYLAPTLFDHVREDMALIQEEIFGPVLCMRRVEHFEEGVASINRHQYGNGATIFTKEGQTARAFSKRVQAGMVGINIPIPVPVTSHPFGGFKRSSFGDTNMHAYESIHFYTRRKTITLKWPESHHIINPFAMPTH